MKGQIFVTCLKQDQKNKHCRVIFRLLWLYLPRVPKILTMSVRVSHVT